MDYETTGATDHNSTVNFDDSKDKKYTARRRIEDWADFRRMRDELGYMDDFTTEFSEVY